MISFFKELDKIFEDLDLSYEISEAQIEVSAYSPEGQDCSATFTATYMEDLLRDMGEWVYSYDADYEASLWIGDDGHGKNGAPYRISDIIADMEWWRNQIDALHDRLIEFDQAHNYAYECCYHCGAEGEYIAEKNIQVCPNCGKHIVICSMCEECIKPCALEQLVRKLNGEDNQ